MNDTLFAIIHLIALLGILVYGIVSIVGGNTKRGVFLLILLAVYYLLVLHKAVKKEIVRKKRR